ncbi:MAG: hypothetical protein HS099_05140 [Ardenticatenaceae bacterium]|nr:hypothetical protein [Ardenticatenaceae bacterium]
MGNDSPRCEGVTAVPLHSLSTPGPNRPTAVPSTTKKHGLHCLTAVPPHSLLRQAETG